MRLQLEAACGHRAEQGSSLSLASSTQLAGSVYFAHVSYMHRIL